MRVVEIQSLKGSEVIALVSPRGVSNYEHAQRGLEHTEQST